MVIGGRLGLGERRMLWEGLSRWEEGRWKERGGVMVGKDGGLRFNKVVLMLEKGEG